ncbi:uncharacterized protein BJ171DRAFT_579404 [Polychytrium aggregatum]|uniref:uncharacterized protein n=1 Tax=Polychytrium aggregatum TaxID=110093 RepID=UPI0022FE05C8|nr:uncharacterized protein BJ171DRAFT_579404 [Polychytrium aggregatum]KAI9207052.1 hypothetical protein BJ171DRAFT_579404 [Polychytrium aggregatum]
MSPTRPAQDAADREAHELFKKHSVLELRSIEARMKVDIEKKGQELRVMVGERYRDLIEAADSIQDMSRSAEKLKSLFERIDGACDAHGLQQAVEAKARPAKTPEEVEQKRVIYTVAAQVKLLVDTPEQIWHALENHQYLRAGRLFTIAKEVHKKLQSSPEAAQVKLTGTFPVVQRQWDAILNLRPQIVQKCTQALKDITARTQIVVDCLCTIMLLNHTSIKETLHQFLALRAEVILGAVGKYESSTQSVSDHVIAAVRAIEATLGQVVDIFMASSSPLVPPSPLTPAISPLLLKSPAALSLLETNILMLQRKLARDDSLSQTSISALFSEKTNIHMVFRHLPQSIQTHTPLLNYGTSSGELREDQIREIVQRWIAALTQSLAGPLCQLLGFVESATNLAIARGNVLSLMQEIEAPADVGSGSGSGFETPLPVLSSKPRKEKSAPKAHRWREICTRLMSESFSVWSDILRAPFQARAKNLISNSFQILGDQPGLLLVPRLEFLADKYAAERDVGRFIWHSQEETAAASLAGLSSAPDKSTTTSLGITVCQPETGSLTFMATEFVETLSRIRLDVTPLVTLAVQAAAYHKALSGAIHTYHDQLLALVQREPETRIGDESKAALRIDQDLFVARTARTIALKSEQIASILVIETPAESAEEIHLQPRRQLSLTDAGKPKLEYNFQLALIHELMMDVYTQSHREWLAATSAKWKRTLQDGIAKNDWLNGIRFAELWESVSVETTTDQGESVQESIVAPCHPSAFLVQGLFELAREINRSIIQQLLTALATSTVEVYKYAAENYSWLTSTHQRSDSSLPPASQASAVISHAGALQILFDFQLIFKILASSDSSLSQSNSVGSAVQALLREKIDPIDLLLVDPHIRSNVDRFYARSAVLLGSITSLGKAVADHRKTPSVQELHSVIPVANQTPRFTLLPIGMSNAGSRIDLDKVGASKNDTQHSKDVGGPGTIPLPRTKPKCTIQLHRMPASQIPESHVSWGDHSRPLTGAEANPTWSLGISNALGQGQVSQQAQKATELLMNVGNFLWTGVNPNTPTGGAGAAASPTMRRKK